MVDHPLDSRSLARRRVIGARSARLLELAMAVGLALADVPSAAAASAPGLDPASGQVVLESRPVVRFLAAIGNATPAERARQAMERLEALPLDADRQAITTQPFDHRGKRGQAVSIGGTPVFSVIEDDLDKSGSDTTESQAGEAAKQLGEALRARRDQHSLPFLLRAIGSSAVATVILCGLLWGLLWLRRRSVIAVTALAQRYARGLERQGLDPAPLVTAGVRGPFNLLSWLGIAALLDVWIVYVLRRFPATAPWADVITDRVLDIIGDLGLAALRAVPGLVGVIIIVLVARALSRFLSGLFDRVASGTFHVTWLHPETVGASRRIAQTLLWLAALAAAYPYLPGSSSDSFKGLSLLIGVMVSLGSTGLMAQAMSGLVIVYSRSLAVGDLIRYGDVVGAVSEVGLLSTKVVTRRGEEVTVPNNVMVAGGVTNFSRLTRGEGALLTTTVTIGYDAPWRQVEALLLGAASRTHGLVAEARPLVLQRSLADFYVTYDLVMRLENPLDRPQVLSELHGHIQDAFNEARVQIMSPHFQVQPPSPVLAPPPGAQAAAPPRSPPVSG